VTRCRFGGRCSDDCFASSVMFDPLGGGCALRHRLHNVGFVAELTAHARHDQRTGRAGPRLDGSGRRRCAGPRWCYARTTAGVCLDAWIRDLAGQVFCRSRSRRRALGEPRWVEVDLDDSLDVGCGHRWLFERAVGEGVRRATARLTVAGQPVCSLDGGLSVVWPSSWTSSHRPSLAAMAA
jgi:hypothetical protein